MYSAQAAINVLPELPSQDINAITAGASDVLFDFNSYQEPLDTSDEAEDPGFDAYGIDPNSI